MVTTRPERYARQLAGHWSGKAEVTVDSGVTSIAFDGGSTAVPRPASGCLEVVASVPEGGDVERFRQLVADHLARFGRRDGLTVTWSD
ncbi:DUF2218 domain-containing protein [Nocardioides taihuensis]|uniref:DUF2218 domain-containing protein n=1 Tax=Nocardioides taihuensis TaxID=1835606 RepID=A0ABW0BKS2_9ACTN